MYRFYYCVVVYGVSRRFQQYFSFIVAVSFIVGGKNRRTRRKSPPVASHWQTLSHNVVSSTLCYEFYYCMLFSMTLVTLNIFVLHFNIFLFCCCNICIFACLFRYSFLAKSSLLCMRKTCIFCFTSIREKLWTLDTQGSDKEIPHNAISVGHHYSQKNTNNVNKTWALLQTTGGNDEPNIVFNAEILADNN
jgi:hypothetical protein